MTLYGLIDGGLEYVNNQPGGGHDLVHATTANMAGSRWGVEDLGGGLKGVYVLESGFETTTGKSSQGGRLFGRQAFVGLQSPWGEIRIGRQTSPLFDIVAIDPMIIAGRYAIAAQDAAYVGRADNSVKYIKDFGRIRASALYSFGADSSKTGGSEIPGNPNLGREFGGYITYSAENLLVSAAYDEINTGTLTSNPDATTRRATIGAVYSINKVSIYGGYRWGKAYDGALLPGAPVSSNQHSNLWWTGARWAVSGALSLVGVAYYQDFSKTNADPWLFVGLADYALSKRSDVFLSVGYAKNRSGSNLGVGSGASGFGTVQPGMNQFGVTVGMRHKF